jgi:hypothetical protein
MGLRLYLMRSIRCSPGQLSFARQERSKLYEIFTHFSRVEMLQSAACNTDSDSITAAFFLSWLIILSAMPIRLHEGSRGYDKRLRNPLLYSIREMSSVFLSFLCSATTLKLHILNHPLLFFFPASNRLKFFRFPSDNFTDRAECLIESAIQ